MNVRRLLAGAGGALALMMMITSARADDGGAPVLLGANQGRAVAGSAEARPAAPSPPNHGGFGATPDAVPSDADTADASDPVAESERLAARRAATRAVEAQPLGGVPEPETPAESGGAESGAMPSWLGRNVTELGRVVGALVLVIGLIFVLRIVLRRMAGPMAGGSRPSGVVEILARYPVGKQQSIVLMRLARRVLVVHHAGQTMTTLTEISDADEVADLLARMESGSRLKDAVRFRKTLEKCQSEHVVAEGAAAPPWPQSANGEAVVIDLTRPNRKRSA